LFEINYYSNNGIAMNFGVLLDNQVLIKFSLFQLCISREFLKTLIFFP